MGSMHVYALVDADKRVRYVGITANPTRRAIEWSNKGPVRFGPTTFVVLEVVAADDAIEAEGRWIARFRAEGQPLGNRSAKGSGYYARSAAHKALMSARLAGVPKSPEAVEKMRAALTGRKRGSFSAEHRQHLSNSLKGRVMSEESRQKMRKPRSEAGKANMRHPKSPEGRAAIAAAQRLRWERHRQAKSQQGSD